MRWTYAARWVLAVALIVGVGAQAAAQGTARPWLEAQRTPDERAALALAAMTAEEKIALLHGVLAEPWVVQGVLTRPPAAAIPAAGYVPGVPRLGLPALYETDASLGVANPDGIRPGDVATALPAYLALAASFNPALAYQAGALVGSEARAKGFNVLLAGGMNLTRDPRNGRNFEYLGEDPLLAGTMAGEAVRGTQSQHVISTVKHFALNANETNRFTLDARIERAALRESDLLAFQIAIERGRPGSVMCAYNEINGEHACASHWLLTDVLKHDWHYPGWVMSDWGAVHGVADAANGLDQESGQQFDKSVYFDGALARAVAAGVVPRARIDDMVRRILRSMFAVGVVDDPPRRADIDYAAHAQVALDIARQGVVLLKNEGNLLPLAAGSQRIAVIGGFANGGVLSGGGSAQVLPSNGAFLRIPTGGQALNWNDELYDPSAPLAAIVQAAPQATVDFDSGEFPARAAALAAKAAVAVVFVTRFEHEGMDIPDLSLPQGQDALIAAVAGANPHTIVVLETGNPVAMPWLAQVPAVLAAWYPGQEGGRALADILFGAVNPSGRLPITFPGAAVGMAGAEALVAGAVQGVRPTLPNLGSDTGAAVHIDYSEGADVGYRWYAAHGVTPLFAFGHGLSYTRFDYDAVKVSGGRRLTVQFDVRNTGKTRGAAVPQVYLVAAAGRPVLRLLGFERVELDPGERRTIQVAADPRLLGSFDEPRRQWRVERGSYRVRIGQSALELMAGGEAVIAAYNEK